MCRKKMRILGNPWISSKRSDRAQHSYQVEILIRLYISQQHYYASKREWKVKSLKIINQIPVYIATETSIA